MNRIPGYGTRPSAAPVATPPAPTKGTPTQIQRIPTYEDFAERASLDPQLHAINLLEDKNWFTPGVYVVAFVAVAFPAWILGGLIGMVVSGVAGAIAGLFTLDQYFIREVQFRALGLTVLIAGIYLNFRFARYWMFRRHQIGSGANARQKSNLAINSLFLIAIVATGGSALLLWIPWRLLQRRNIRTTQRIYQAQRDQRTP